MKKIFILVVTMIFLVGSLFAKDTNLSLLESIEKGLLGTILYSISGMLMAIVAYKLIDVVIPGKISEQITEHKNTAVAMVVAALMLGICIIIAAAIVS
jgi:uncharacterized membrane protein YjfL (UPF0719 family)